MNGWQAEWGLGLAMLLFGIGLLGVMVRRNLVFLLLSIEIMLNAAALAFIVAGAKWGQADGQVAYLFVLTVAAAEVAVGLALVLRLHETARTLSSDEVNQLRG